VGRLLANGSGLLDQAGPEACSANPASRECHRHHPAPHKVVFARSAVSRKAAAGAVACSTRGSGRRGRAASRAPRRPGEGGLAGVGAGGPVPVIIRGQRWATPVEVAASFAAASAGIDVPLAHTILRRSVVEYHAGEHRLCVLDACSAAEVALGTAMTVSLRQHGLADAEREQMLKLASGIAEAFPLYQRLVMMGQSTVSRGRVLDQLASPRNRAAHGGERPDETVAQRALETAGQLVYEAIPLTPPDEMLRVARAQARRRRGVAPGSA
jgi:hypothetical protein